MQMQNLINDVKVRCPSGFSDGQIMMWVNAIIAEIWEDIAQETIAEIEITSGVNEYVLPADCEINGIFAVLVNNVNYCGKSVPDYNGNNIYFRGNEGEIIIAPAVNGIMKIFYLKKPNAVNSLTGEVVIRERFAELVKCGVMCIIAKALGNVPLANNYAADYNAALGEAKQRRLLWGAAYPTILNK